MGKLCVEELNVTEDCRVLGEAPNAFDYREGFELS